jgi:hypothetical protein
VKVEVDFPGEFGASGPTAIELGRISLNGAIVRVVFDPRGFVQLLIPAEAIEDGYVVFSKPPRGVLGLPEEPPKDGHLKWMPVARPISGTVMFHDRVLYRWQDGKYHPVMQTEVEGLES